MDFLSSSDGEHCGAEDITIEGDAGTSEGDADTSEGNAGTVEGEAGASSDDINFL